MATITMSNIVAPTTTESQVTDTSQNLRKRGTRQYPGLAAPNGKIIRVSTEQYAEPLEDDDLLEVAFALGRLELHVFELRVGNYKASLTNKVDAWDKALSETSIAYRKDALALLEPAISAFRDVFTGKYPFSIQYLRDSDLNEYWVDYESNIRIWFTKQTPNATTLREVESAERLAITLATSLKLAAGEGKLDKITRYAIGEKYDVIERILQVYWDHTKQERKIPTWLELQNTLMELDPRRTPKRNLQSSSKLSMLLWITFIVTVVFSGLMLALAWKFTDSALHTWREDDFFFLVQGSILQILTLVSTAVTLRRAKNVPLAAWVAPSLFSGFATILAAILYCYVPKWWTSFLTLVAASIQAFMVLQLALYGA